MEKLHYKIYVRGKVQGVWFRRYTKEKADTLGLKGFVKNEFESSVYIEVEGVKSKLDKLVNWLHGGSPLAKVSSVEYSIGELQDYVTFKIDR